MLLIGEIVMEYFSSIIAVTTLSEALTMYCMQCNGINGESVSESCKKLTHAVVLVRLLTIIILLCVAKDKSGRKYDEVFHYLPSVV